VLAAERLRACTERHIKTADALERRSPEGHVAAGAEGRKRVQRMLSPRRRTRVHEALEPASLAVATAQLEPLLSGRLEFGGNDHASHGVGLRTCLEDSTDLAEPEAIRHLVVVDVRDEVGVRLLNRPV